MDKKEIVDLVIHSAKIIVEEEATYNPEKIKFNTPLYSRSGILDSFGLVQLVANIEEEIFKRTNKQIIIVDEKALSMKISPFRTVSSLADHIYGLIDN